MAIRTSKAFAIILVVIGCAVGPQATAWEIDVHYVLTSWLAEKAGFSRADANEIAQADQSLDDSHYHAAISTMIWIQLSGDQGAAQSLQDNHFPSGARLPAPAQSRVVGPGDHYARDAVDAAVRPGQQDPSLRKLGEALHPFQDSWSHQGVPDIPLGLRPELGCAHPAARGGWRRHDADLTYLHPQDAVVEARETYKILELFLRRYPRFKSHASAGWKDLERVIEDFAGMRTKAERDAWAVKWNQSKPGSSPAGITMAGARGVQPGRIIRTVSASKEPAPPALLDTARKLNDTWFRAQDIAAASGFVNWSMLATQFNEKDSAVLGQDRSAIIQWCRRFMTMFLVDDHAAVNRDGHCDPKQPGYRELPELPVREGLLRARKAVQLAQVTPDDFFHIANSRDFALVFQPEGLPYDTICLIWTDEGGTWQIKRMFAIAG